MQRNYGNERREKQEEKQVAKYVVITVCFNEALIIPHFLHNYRDAQQIIVYDDGSTDESLNLLKQNPIVTVREHTFGERDKLDERKITFVKNEIWQEYKEMEFVIVVDMDEFVCSTKEEESVGNLLFTLKHAFPKTAFFRGTCFDMHNVEGNDVFVKEKGDEVHKNLIKSIKKGFFNQQYSKVVILNPQGIATLRYVDGAHRCTFRLNRGFENHNPTNPPILLLHFRYAFGEDAFVARREGLKKRVGEYNRKHNLGDHLFARSEEENRSEYRNAMKKTYLVDVDEKALQEWCAHIPTIPSR